jgi:carboxyl-terminal processing protease
MENRKSFIMGIGLGAFITAMIMLAAVAGINVYGRQVRWRGIDPNTKIMEIYDLLNTFSIVPFDKNEMLENMYRGLLEGVNDPYTQYFDSAALAAFRARTDGTFVGIGVNIGVEEDDPYVTIIHTFRDAPAAQAGILPGDKIVAVDGVNVAGFQREDIVGMVTGPEGDNINLIGIPPMLAGDAELDWVQQALDLIDERS